MKLVLSREKAVRLFIQLGFKTADNWTNKELEKKLKNVPDLMDGIKLDSFKMKKTFTKITRADSVRIRSDNEDDIGKGSKLAKKKKKVKKDEEAVEPKKTTKKKAKKKTEKAVEPKKTKKKKKAATAAEPKKTKKNKSQPKKDKFGSKVGSFRARVNAVLSKKSMTRKEILEKVGEKGSVSSHLKKLVADGFLTQNKDGAYKLKK